jgi:presenilin-like A22 family membrane protease
MECLNGSRRRATVVLVALVILAQVSALLIALPIVDADRSVSDGGGAAGDGPGVGTDTTDGFDVMLGQVAALLGVTLLALLVRRQQLFSNRQLVRGAVLSLIGATAVFPLLFPAGALLWAIGIQSVAATYLVSITLAAGLSALAGWRPTWYSLTALGLVAAVGAAASLAIQFGILPILILCLLLVAYDAASVYGSGHMVELADRALDLQLPVLVTIPTRRSARPLGDDSDAEAVALGLGDIIIPGLLVVASARAVSTGLLPVGGLDVPLATVTALAGTVVGLVGIYASGSGPHAGLPPMLGGGLVGYLAGALGTGTGLSAALGVDSLDAGLVSLQTIGLAVLIVAVGAALFLYGTRSTEVTNP